MNAKAAASRHQRQVLELARLPGNDFCADCTGRNPRWASHNLGIFLCISCAGIHRKMGTHISKVKSLTLDEWSREQIAVMKEMGNIKSNAYYNPDERRNRPPANIEDSERDGELERFIRDKYEFRRFMDKRPPPLPKKDPTSPVHGHRSMTVSNGSSSSSATASRNGTLAAPASSSSVGKGILRSSTAPIPSSWKEAKRAASPLPPPPPRDEAFTATASNLPPSIAVSSPGQRSSQSYASVAPFNGMNGSSTSTLSPSGYANGAQPPLPTRASSALAFSSSSATTTPTLSSSGTGSSSSMLPSQQPQLQQSQQSSFQGRSSVFDDLLELSKPAAPPPQPQLQQPQQMAYNNPYDQQGIMSSLQMGMNGMGLHANQSATTNMANPWAQQQQQQQMLMANYQQSAVSTPMGLSAGAMGYQHTNGMGMMQQQTSQQSPSGYFVSSGSGGGGQWTPSDLGGMAFGGMTSAVNGANPYFAQQASQQPQYVQQPTYGASSYPTASPFQAQQQQQQGNVFDQWAAGMMPGNR